MLIKGIQLHHCRVSQPISAVCFLQHLRAAHGPLLVSWVLSGAYLFKLAVPSGAFRGGAAGTAASHLAAAVLKVAAGRF